MCDDTEDTDPVFVAFQGILCEKMLPPLQNRCVINISDLENLLISLLF